MNPDKVPGDPIFFRQASLAAEKKYSSTQASVSFLRTITSLPNRQGGAGLWRLVQPKAKKAKKDKKHLNTCIDIMSQNLRRFREEKSSTETYSWDE
jgi:hypothetical protein